MTSLVSSVSPRSALRHPQFDQGTSIGPRSTGSPRGAPVMSAGTSGVFFPLSRNGAPAAGVNPLAGSPGVVGKALNQACENSCNAISPGTGVLPSNIPEM